MPKGWWDTRAGQTVQVSLLEHPSWNFYLSQVGAGGVVELSDDYGMTGNRAVEVTRVRIKNGKMYKPGPRIV